MGHYDDLRYPEDQRSQDEMADKIATHSNTADYPFEDLKGAVPPEEEQKAFDYLEEQAKSEQEAIQKVATLEEIEEFAQQFDEVSAEIARIEEELSVEKKKLKRLSQKKIPEAFISLGLSSIRLKDGREFGYKEDVSCSVKDFKAFAEFLEEQGDASIIKTNLEIGKVPAPILRKMTGFIYENFGILVEPKQGVHSQTLAKYIRELCGIGGETEATVSLEELDREMISTYTYYKTTVKSGKKRKKKKK